MVMAVNRTSTSLVRYLGAEVSARNNNGSLANVVQSGQGKEIVQPADSQRVFNSSLTPASVKIADFDAAFGYLQGKGATPLAAKAMALVIVDAAKAQGVSVMSILEQRNSNKLALLDAKTYNYINQLRDRSSQLSNSTTVDNKKSVRSRYLIA